MQTQKITTIAGYEITMRIEAEAEGYMDGEHFTLECSNGVSGGVLHHYPAGCSHDEAIRDARQNAESYFTRGGFAGTPQQVAEKLARLRETVAQMR